MANALANYLSKYFTNEVKQEAQEILNLNRPASVDFLQFSQGKIDLITYCNLYTYCIKTFIPGDICLVDVSGCEDHFRVLDNKEFIPNEATVISLYFYFMERCLKREEYFTWLRNILVNHYKLKDSSFNSMLLSILGSRIYRGEGFTKFIEGSNRQHRDILDFYEWIRQNLNGVESEG